MKRLFVLAALTAACGATLAQSATGNVTLYGIVDGGISHTTGLKGGSKSELVSGVMEGTRFGLRGNEDLGGGYRALFTLENRTEVDTGAVWNRPPSGSQLPDRIVKAEYLNLSPLYQPALDAITPLLGAKAGVNHIDKNLFDRQAYVGLVTPFGGFLAGRQYTPAYEVASTFDTLGTQSSLAWGQTGAFPSTIDIRVSDALQYRIQQGAFTAGLMLTFPGGANGKTSANRLVGLQAMYRTDAFSAGLGYNQRNNEIGDKSLTSLVLGASAKVGPGTVSAAYAKVKDDHPTGMADLKAGLMASGATEPAAEFFRGVFSGALQQDADSYHIGYRITTGPHTIYAAFSALNDKRPANADVASYGAVYTYAFSKRTDLNVVLTHFNNKNLAQAAPGQAGFVGGVTESAGTDSNNVALGIRHRF